MDYKNNGVITYHKRYSCLSWNIRSLKLRFIDVLHYVKECKPSIICLQESLKQHENYNIRGYIKYDHDINQGLTTFIKNTVPHTLVKVSNTLTPSNSFMLFKINDEHHPFHVCNTYIRTDKLNTLELPDPNSYDRIIYCGDFNARHKTLENITKAKTNKNGKMFLDFVLNNNIKIHDTPKETHILGGRLDYIMSCGLENYDIQSGSEPALLSDHYGLFFNVYIPTTVSPLVKRRKVNIPSYLVAPFWSFICDWFENYEIKGVESFNNDLISKVHEFQDTYLNSNAKGGQHTSKKKCWTEDNRLKEFKVELAKAIDDFRSNSNVDNIKAYLLKLNEFRDLKNTARIDHFNKFLQSLNAHTNPSIIWKEIRALIGNKCNIAISKDAKTIAEDLLNQYAFTSSFASLPTTIRDELKSTSFDRQMTIEIACAKKNEFDDAMITQWELDMALEHGKSTAPGEDGITYQVIRLLNRETKKGNPILILLNMSLTHSLLPTPWTSNLIVPVPKKDSDQMRPISLTSCLCKVLERIVLNRIKFILGDKLDKNLYGFMNGKSTRDCFAEYMISEPIRNVTTFVDLKSAFDKANRSIILEHLATLGIDGKLLTWVRGYLSNRYSKVYFRGYMTEDDKLFELGTPQGGVLSPFLFNVLIDRLIRNLKLKLHMENISATIICYADDICFKTKTFQDMQILMTYFHDLTVKNGLVISVPKTKLQHTNNCTGEIKIGDNSIEKCKSYRYLGIETPLPKDYVKQLKTRITRRLRPLRLLAGRSAGANIDMCRTFYLAYIRSLIDYHALHLCTRPARELDTLEQVQNEAMRIILGCPMSTRVVNMLCELKLPTLSDHINKTITVYGIKILQSAKPHCNQCHCQTDNETPLTQITALNHNDIATTLHRYIYHFDSLEQAQTAKFIRRIGNEIRQHNIEIKCNTSITQSHPPFNNAKAYITYPSFSLSHNKNTTPQNMLKSLSLEHIDETLKKCYGNPQQVTIIYTDGSLLTSTGQAGCALIIYKPGREQDTRSKALPRWSSSTYSELQALNEAVKYATILKKDTLIICDSQSALQSINSSNPLHAEPVNTIRKNLFASEISINPAYKIGFTWIPSHVGVKGNELADRFAQEAARLSVGMSECLTIGQFKTLIKSEQQKMLTTRKNRERAASCTIKHYDNFKNVRHTYGKNKMHTGPCDRIAARIRLGYRKIWQLNLEKHGTFNEEYAKCELCDATQSNTLEHYIEFCPKLKPFRPNGLGFFELCVHFCKPETLYPILTIYPNFRF